MVALPPAQDRVRGILFRLGAALCFGIMAACIKLGYQHGAHLMETVFYRFAFGLLPLLAWIGWRGRWDAWRTARPRAHALRAAIGLTAMTLSFGALAYLPLAEATTISFAAPLFGVILSALLLGERVGRHRWTAVAAGFAGVVIVMRPDAAHLPPLGIALALAGAFGVACVTVAIRAIGRTDAPETTVLWFTCISAIATGAMMPVFGRPHDAATFAILAGVGLSGGIAQLLMTNSLRLAPVSTVMPFDYLQLLCAVGFGWAIWDTHPAATTWIGGAIIVAGGLYTLYREHRLGRDRPAEPVI